MLREEEIRPESLMAGQAERFAADIQRLLEHRAQFVEVPCPACGATEARHSFEKYTLAYVTCETCETLYLNPRPNPEVLEVYYATSENYAYWNQYIFPASEQARRVKIFRPRAERLVEIARRHGTLGGTLLEVGAGFGIFCEEVAKLGMFQRVIGVEPTPDLAGTCRSKGIEVIEKPIEHVELPPGSVDVVASFEVIEHLFSPGDFVRACASMLAPGGLLVLTCPNGKGFEVSTLQALSDTVDVEHLNYFHPSSLSGLLRASGLEVLEATTPGKLDAELVRKKIIEGRFSVADQAFLQKVLVDDWDRLGEPFQAFLAENGLSSHMWLVARKLHD